MLPYMQWGKIQNVQQTSVILLSGAVWIECLDSDLIGSGTIWCLNKPKHACCGMGTVEMRMKCGPEGSSRTLWTEKRRLAVCLSPCLPDCFGQILWFQLWDTKKQDQCSLFFRRGQSPKAAVTIMHSMFTYSHTKLCAHKSPHLLCIRH